MSISVTQKKIIDISKKLINENKKFNKHQISELTYFALWGNTQGFARIKYKLYGFKNILNYWFRIVKDIAKIAYLNNYTILKNSNFSSKIYKKIIVSRSIIEDFDKNGNYKDRYFLIKSNNEKKTLFILINAGAKKPKKIGKNVVIIYQKKKIVKLFFFFQIFNIKIKIFKFFFKKVLL